MRSLRQVILLACAGLWPGCGSAPEYSVHTAVAEAEVRWYSATGAAAQISAVIPREGGIACGFKVADGCYNRRTHRLQVREDMSKQNIIDIALHEVGHAIGAKHSEQEGETMYPTVPNEACITENDIALACEDNPDCQWSEPER